MNLTAQQMLASLPVRRYADGGEATNVVPSWQADASAGRARAIAVGNEEAWLAQVKATAEKYMQNPGTAAEAYDAMVKSGIGIKDLLDSGISQDTINRALSIPTAEAQKQVNALATTAITSTLAQNPTLANEIANRGAPAIYEQARQFVANLQKDGLTDAERQYMQQVASQQGWGYSDIRAAGIDPTILFSPVPEVKKPPVTPVTPAVPGTVTPVFQPPVPYTPVNVYQPLPTQPDIYAPGQPALDVAFRESAPRTAIPGMPGSYEYTPAAKLRPATGAGYSWTPPSVTSRPRSLLSPTLLSYVSPSQQFAQSRAAQDQALLGAFRSSGLPQNASNFYSWRNRLRSGEFGAGSAFDPTAFQSAFSSWASSQPPAAGTTAQGSAAPLGSVTGYSEIAGGLQPIDLRAMPFAEGGEVSAREMLDRLKKPEGIEAEGLGAQTPRNLPRERMNARRARAGMEPFVPQAPTKTAGQTAADMLSGMSIPLSVVPVAGDVAGLAADAAMYAAYPEERTLANYGLTALGALPFVPAASAARTGKKAAEALKELSEAERKANLERFMAGSKVIDESGQPVVQYRGMTHGDIDPTQTKGGRKLIFTTPDKSTANNFAMIRGRDPDASPYVAPLYVRAQNPFDFTNKAHIAQMERELPKILSRSSPSREPMTRSEIKDAIAAIRRGDWGAIEDVAENTDYFERAGFDSLYVNEGGVKNLAVFDPTQIKSAIGNEGTFDPANPVITKANGGEVTTEELLAQMDRIGGQPVPGVRGPQTESRSMLQNLMQGAREIPGTLSRYGARVAGSESPMTTLGQDLSKFGGAVVQGFKESPGEFLLDVLPVVGELRSASDVDKFSRMANEAEAQGNMDLARIYRELVAVSAMGAAPLAGMGARAGKTALKGAAKAAQEAATAAPVSTAREMLDEVIPQEGALSPAVTRPVEPQPLTDAAKALAEMDNIQAQVDEAASVRPTITGDIEDRRRVGTTGRYVGAPEGVNTPQKLAALTRSIMNLTKEGEFGRFWYERSGRQILDIAGGNKEDADKLVQAIAITSPNTPVGANFDYALQAYYQWKNGQPIKTGMYTTEMSNKLQRMFDGEEWAGRKTNNFYNNLMREIDPSKAQGVTTDIWMMRAFGFDKEAPTPAQYSFVENETKRIAQNLGWEPQQVQAAIWVALKSRMENPDVKKAVEAKSFEKGWMTYDEKGDRVVLDKNKHAANWLEYALRHSPTEADREAAKFDYADAAANNLAQISWESIPSRTSMHMPEIFEAPPEVVQDYHVQMSKAFLDDEGNDIIAKELEILSPGDFEAPGYFEQRVSPGTQTNVTVPRQYGVTRRVEQIKKQAAEEGWSKEQRDAAIRAATYATEPAAKDAMLAYAAARGILLKQDGVGMHRPAFISGLSRPKANGIQVDIGRPLTARETSELARLVATEAGHTEYNPIASPNGVRFINFDYLGAPNLDFQKTINRALEKMNFDNDEPVNAKMFGADTGYLGNNWTEKFNGEGYLDTGDLARRPDLQRKVRDIVARLAPRVSAVEDEFANRYNWTRNRQLNSAYEAQQEVGAAPVATPQGIESLELPTQAVEKQGTLGDALTQLNITPQRMEQWRASREGMRQERVPQVQEAAEALREGKITTEQYQQTVREYQPIRSLGAVQKMPTVEEIAMALGKNAEKSPGIVGVNVDLPNGTRVASRLDIPAYEKYDTWVVSLHDGNKTGGNAIAYGQAAVLNNVDFMSSAKAALNIATGKTAKGTIARMYGDWENRNPEMVAQQAQDILSGKAPDAADWAEVGMNPARHSYFYRKSDGMPVASAEQVIQVGPLVLAKKPVTRPVESPEHLINTPEGPRYFKKGGNVERVTNDNRKYF